MLFCHGADPNAAITQQLSSSICVSMCVTIRVEAGSFASMRSLGSAGNDRSFNKRRADSGMSGGSENDPWGWFEDVETDAHGGSELINGQGELHRSR